MINYFYVHKSLEKEHNETVQHLGRKFTSDRADDFSQLVILCSYLCMPVEHTNTGKWNETNSEKSGDL